jgi:hypothetical protein
MISLLILRHSKYGLDALLLMSKNEELQNSVDTCVSLCYAHITFEATSALAQGTPYDEEYMQQHDGGDRAEYLQEMESSNPRIYVPPVNDASQSTPVNNVPPN